MNTAETTTETTRSDSYWFSVPADTTSLLNVLKNYFDPMTVIALSASESVSPTLTTITRLAKSVGFYATAAIGTSGGLTVLDSMQFASISKVGE